MIRERVELSIRIENLGPIGPVLPTSDVMENLETPTIVGVLPTSNVMDNVYQGTQTFPDTERLVRSLTSLEPYVYSDLEDALLWVINHQLGRRNLNEKQTAALRGNRYLVEKSTDKFHGNQYTSGGDHCDHHQNTAERLAEETGVSAPTVRRDAKFAEAVNTLAEVDKGMKDALLADDATKKQVFTTAPVISCFKGKLAWTASKLYCETSAILGAMWGSEVDRQSEGRPQNSENFRSFSWRDYGFTSSRDAVTCERVGEQCRV